MEDVSKLIRRFRMRSNLSQMDLELAIGSAPGSISRIENGKVEPSKQTLKKIIKVLNLPTDEAALLFTLDINDYKLLIDSVNKIHAQSNKPDMLQIALNECLSVFKLQGCSLFLIQNGELVLTATGQSWYTKPAMKLLKLPFDKVRFSLTKHPKNALVLCANENRIVIAQKLSDCLKPVVPNRISNLIEKLIGMKGFCNLPIKTSTGSVVGVLAISFSDTDVVQEKFPALLGYCNTISTALEKFTI